MIAPLLNERISEVVWTESLKQTEQMMNWVETNNEFLTNSVVDGLKTIAINVLGAAGYGSSRSWTPSGNSISAEPTSEPFFDSVSLQTQFFILTALVPTSILRLPFMPQQIQDLAAAKLNFPRYAQDLISAERVAQAESLEAGSNIMAMLVKTLDQSDELAEEDPKKQRKGAMSADEVQGNLFILSIAGFETTANTMVYAIVLLAIYPKWQEWLIEEIDSVVSQNPESHYEQSYPKLVRCLAFMVGVSITKALSSPLISWQFEVLRIYTPVGHTCRVVTSDQVVKLPSSGKTYNLPAGLKFTFGNQGVHLNPSIYGANAQEFDPTRWISTDLSSASDVSRESLVHPPKATFLPWSSGPRICPGMKMAQVEFVAVVFEILKSYTVAPGIRHKGQTLDNAREKLKECMADSRQRITLMMNRPQDVWVSWKKR
jgi:cytochrome P450